MTTGWQLDSRTHHFTYFGFIQLPINLPEVFSEEIFSNGLPIYSDPLSYLNQVWRTANTQTEQL